MKGWTTLTKFFDFRRVIYNQKSVGTGRAAAAAPLDEYSARYRNCLAFTTKEVVSSMLAASVSSKHLLEVKCSHTN